MCACMCDGEGSLDCHNLSLAGPMQVILCFSESLKQALSYGTIKKINIYFCPKLKKSVGYISGGKVQNWTVSKMLS